MANKRNWGPPPEDPEAVSPPPEYLDAIEARLGPVPTTQAGTPPVVIHHRSDVPWVVLGRTAVPQHFMAVVTDPRYPGCVLDLEVENGTAVFNRVTFVRRPGGPPLRAAEMRIPVDDFRIRALAVAVAEVVSLQEDGLVTLRRGGDTAQDFAAEYEGLAEHRTRRGSRLSDADLAEVAEIYREALASSEPTVRRAPSRQVALRKHTSESNARRWVQLARKRGLLGLATPRRAGEQTVEKGDKDG